MAENTAEKKLTKTMKDAFLEKVTLNIGAGEGGQKLENARALLERVSGRTAVVTKARARNPAFKIRKGDAIGVKVTLRGTAAREFLKRALEVVDKNIPARSFDEFGNVAFGVKEYIDLPGMKYDPAIGMMGFDVCITLCKAGARVSRRRIAKRRIPAKQRVSKAEAMDFLRKEFGVNIVSREE
ncbi:MAG: 50S ribosomal protein L5 [Candidatus Norongarragalinales archaeon]